MKFFTQNNIYAKYREIWLGGFSRKREDTNGAASGHGRGDRGENIVYKDTINIQIK